MPICLERELYRAAILTFEELSFMLPADILDARQQAAKPSARASISFAGPFNGNLVVTAFGDILPMVSANMLGQDTPPAQNEQLDALREISNVVCGNLLPSLAGSEAIFDIFPPAVVSLAGPGLQGEMSAEVEIGLGGGRFHFALALVGFKPNGEHAA